MSKEGSPPRAGNPHGLWDTLPRCLGLRLTLNLVVVVVVVEVVVVGVVVVVVVVLVVLVRGVRGVRGRVRLALEA